jgi:KipI family sensor histidine kinase inhibitor
MRTAPAGDNALLIDLGAVSASALHAAAESVRSVQSVTACIPGHSSLYVICEGWPDVARIADAAHLGSPAVRPSPRVVRIRISFANEHAPDLEELLQSTATTHAAFMARMEGLRLTARHLGFRGGFAYLDGWPQEWAMPRRATPRPHVPRGSFGIAGSVAGFYPIDSPGGWNLLGRTDADLEHAIAPGDVLELEPALEPIAAGAVPGGAHRLDLEYADVLSAPLARVVGAPDWKGLDYGRPPGGAFDELAAALANRAVGNPPTAPLLECAFTRPHLRFRRPAVVAWCGAGLDVSVCEVNEGEEFRVGAIRDGLRGYLAVGDTRGPVSRTIRDDRLVIRYLQGPHEADLGDVECVVTPRLDRVGIRMEPLRRLDAAIPADLPSCGMQFGTVQLHPDGSLVAMGPDHPITGGYLQPMTVPLSERWKLAHLTPGERVRLVRAQAPDI